MSMLDRLTDFHEQVQPLLCREIFLVAVFGDLDPAHQFHDEVGTAAWNLRFAICDLRFGRFPLTPAIAPSGGEGARRVGEGALRCSRVKHFCDVRVVHHGQRLALSFESRNHAPGIHAQLDDLERHAPAERLLLLSHVHYSATSLADLLEELVASNFVSRFFQNC